MKLKSFDFTVFPAAETSLQDAYETSKLVLSPTTISEDNWVAQAQCQDTGAFRGRYSTALAVGRHCDTDGGC